jgi:tape measure domain-containing protein
VADNKYIGAINEIKLGIKSIIAEMEIADRKIVELASKASTIGSAFKNNTPDGLTKSINEQTTALKLLTEQLSKQTTNSEGLAREKKKLIVLTGQENINNRQLAKNADLYARSTSKLVGAYGNLIAKQKMAKRALQDLIAAEKQNTAQIKNAQREYNKYTARVNQANKATSNFAKNSLGGMIRGFKNLVSSFGLILGAQGFAQLIGSLLNTTKKVQSLDFSLRAITKTQENFVKVQGFLNEITEKYGLNLISVTERYTKFLAAANQSGLAMRDTEQIFDSVSKASAVLGLRTDELTGVYLALEQMLSKGKVTTEELRRQLGERLPGAFGIMADAIGVSVAELDKMLKKGEILSSEALPKFAAQLEKAYGIENINRVDTLVAATQRLENSWTNFVKNLESSEGRISKVFISIFESLTDIVNLLADLNTTDKDAFTILAESIRKSALTDELNKLEIQAVKTGLTLEEVAKLNLAEMSFEYRKASSSVNQLKIELSGSKKELENQGLGWRQNTKYAQGLKKDIDELTEMIEEESKQLAVKKGRLDAVNQVLAKNTKIVEENTEAESKTIEAKRGSIAFQEAYIKTLEDEQQKLATTSQEYAEYTRQIEEANEALVILKANLNVGIEGETFGIDPEMFDESEKSGFDKMFENAENAMDRLTKSQAEKRLAELSEEKRHRDAIDGIVKASFDTFSEYYDLDLEKFEFLYDGKKNKLEDWMTAFDAVIDSALDASLNRYDIELQAAQRSRDLIVNNELSTEKEKRLAREKFEIEERRIKTERAKKERQNTLVQIAVDTARGAILAYLSQLIPGDPTSIPRAFGAAAITTGFGLAQAALVASQPIPEFAEGTKAPLAKDTLAIVGDGGRKEAITENGKLVGVTPDKPTLMNLKKGQEVQKDAHSWIDNAVYRMNMESNGEMLSSVMMDNIMHDEMKKMRAESKRTWEEVKKLASRPINVSNRVIVESKMNEYKQ